MRAVFGLVLVTGLGLAGTAVYMVRGHFEAQAAQLAQTQAIAAAAVPTVKVYAVTRAVGYGDRLTPADVQLIDYAEPFLPAGVFRTEQELFPDGPEELRTVLRPMEPNEPVLLVKVTQPGEDAGITSRLSEGMRAFTISVDVSSGVSGFLRPGDNVDVYWTGTVEEGGQDARRVTQLIESGLEVIGINQTSDDTTGQVGVAKTVTVEVSPQQVANLAQAQSTGGLSLSLVGHKDETVAAAIEVDQKSLLGLEDAPVAAPVVVPEPPPPPRVCSVRTRRAGEVIDTTQVDCPTEQAAASPEEPEADLSGDEASSSSR